MAYWDDTNYEIQDRQFRREWWQAPEGEEDEQVRKERAQSLVDLVKGLEDSQRSAHEQNLWNARLYSNRELVNFDWGHGVFYNTTLSPVSLLGENLVLSVVETLVSRVGKQRTKVTPTPRGASWKVYRQTKKLDKWLVGEFSRLKLYAKTKRAFRDACIFGFGALKVELGKDKRMEVRRVFPDDLIVDQSEVANSDDNRVTHIYERRCRRIEEVEAAYDLPEGTIRGVAKKNYLTYRSPGRGWCVVVEGYRAACEGVPGRHYIAVEGGIQLLDEPWKHEFVPYVWYHYNDPISGFYWPSVVEQVLPFQIRLNEINEVIRDAQDLMARPRIFVAEGSRVTAADIDNLTARIIKYTGVMPEAMSWDAVSPELYNERERQIRACYEQFGLMPMVAQGKLPQAARLDSSAALQEATTIGDDRQADPMQRFEEFHLLLGEMMIRIMGDGGEGETTWYQGGRKNRAETIKWHEIDLDENAYVLTLDAASVFSLTPAARRDKLEDWLVKGIISQEQYWEYSSNPDIDAIQNLQGAARRDLQRVRDILEDGKYESPTPIQDLVNGTQLMTFAYYELGDYEGVPAKVKENFIKWISMARAIIRQGTQTPDAQGVGSVTQQEPSPGGPVMPVAPTAMAPPGVMMPMAPMPGAAPGMGPGMMPGGMV